MTEDPGRVGILKGGNNGHHDVLKRHPIPGVGLIYPASAQNLSMEEGGV